METTYDCLGLPFVFRPIVPVFVGALLLWTGRSMVGYQSPELVTGIILAGVSAILLAAWMLAFTARKVVVHESKIGFIFILAPAEWYPKRSVFARVRVQKSRWPQLPYALQFIAPRPWYRPAILLEPSMLMTDDGRTLEYTNLETAFGIPVNWPPN